MARAAVLAGAPAGGLPIRVVLVPERSELARRAPAWLAGFAESERSLVVLFPRRVPLYPDRSLEQLLLHELAHVLIDRATGYRPVPRWFHEGLALVAGGPWDLRDGSQLTLVMLREGEIDLAELDRRFADPGELADAYAIAGALVRDLLQRHGADLPARLLAAMRGGEGFEGAFRRVTGEAPAVANRSFWRRYAFWYRWVPVLTSSTTLWLAVTLLALAAIRRRRRRDAERLARWDALDGGAPDETRQQPP